MDVKAKQMFLLSRTIKEDTCTFGQPIPLSEIECFNTTHFYLLFYEKSVIYAFYYTKIYFGARSLSIQVLDSLGLCWLSDNGLHP